MKLVRFWRNIAGMDIAWHGCMSMGQNNQLYTQIEWLNTQTATRMFHWYPNLHPYSPPILNAHNLNHCVGDCNRHTVFELFDAIQWWRLTWTSDGIIYWLGQFHWGRIIPMLKDTSTPLMRVGPCSIQDAVPLGPSQWQVLEHPEDDCAARRALAPWGDHGIPKKTAARCGKWW